MSGIVTNYLKSSAESIAENYGLEKWNELAKDKLFKMKDPFRDVETGKRLKLPAELSPSKADAKFWRKVQNKAWRDDKCFLSCCGFYMDCCLGIGMGPMIVLIPTIGPIIMYYVHNNLIRMVQKQRPGLIDGKTLAKMHANIMFDLLISLPPVVGMFFTWMNGCSTRNSVLVYLCLLKELESKNHQQMKRAHHRANHEPGSDLEVQSIPLNDIGNSHSSFERVTDIPQAPSKASTVQPTVNNTATYAEGGKQPLSPRRVPPPGHTSDPLSL